MAHSFSRTELLLGPEALETLKHCKVSVFGVGGVGSFAVEGLVRAGVGEFVLVDHDTVCVTNLNRQLHATCKTVGKSKVALMRDRILDINPHAAVTIYREFYSEETAERLVHSDSDYIVDAIDTVSAKIDLVVRAKALHIPIISSMGAGNKLDPTKFEVTYLYKTSVDPLARVMRRELRKREIDALKVVYSKEEPLKPLKPDHRGQTDDMGTKEDSAGTSKRQIPGSVAWVPSVAGLIIAGEVVKDLACRS